ncbi:phosphomannomutase/phosphoglucomutase [Patescibacteria group bacterium]|nr:phosphomannomutase/phosphoglucomutase [Patescibacteria group bacterium]
MAKLNKYIFREYDIRGRESKDELNNDTIGLIARSYGTFLRKRGIKDAIVGHDNRKTSDDFYRISVEALRDTGIDVIGIGTCLTPMMYWSQYHFKVKGGLIITASHNPSGWNGLKLALGYSYTLLGEELEEIKKNAESEKFETGNGNFERKDISDKYINDLLSRTKLDKKLKIVINTANATSSFVSPKIFKKFGCEVVEHNTNPDPSYPNYVPNPANVEMMEDTGKQVLKNKADVGIAIDADGDRLGVTDEKGETIWPDRWLILLSRLVLQKNPGATIIFDVKVSEALPEDIKARGGIPIMWKTGHSYIKEKMHKEKAILAGEQSGHVFFLNDFYGFDDANFAGLKLLEYISQQKEPLSEIISKTPYYVSTPAYHARTEDKVKYEIVDKLTEEFKSEGYNVVDINGARVYLKGGWGLVRASSNLPALVLRFEAKNDKDLKEIEDIFRKKLEKYPDVAKKWESA